MKRRNFLITTAVLPLSLTIPAKLLSAETVSLTLAINRTGRCRMLSQRATKAYALVALKVSPARWKAIMDECASDMRSAMEEVDKYNRGRSFANAKNEFSSQLLPFLGLLKQAPVTVNLVELAASSDKVLVAANTMAELLVAESRSTLTTAVNKSGRQRMLTQRMARNYVLLEAKVPGENFKESIERDRKLFADAQAELVSAPMNSAEIKASLEKSSKLWGAFWAATTQSGGTETVAAQSETLLTELDLLTRMYEKLG
jgi:nitrate/nitrite-specific signal transduction histidine kinase